jgi:hypothetical protein
MLAEKGTLSHKVGDMNMEKLRLFVAMPGTSMGNAAEWTDPDKIKTLIVTDFGGQDL